MIFIDLLFVFFIALLISGALFSGRGRRDGWSAVALLFAVIFMTTWAGSLWVTPFGPSLWGVSWLPLLTVGLITALIIGTFSSPHQDRSAPEQYERTSSVMWGFFWIVLILLVITIVTGYAV